MGMVVMWAVALGVLITNLSTSPDVAIAAPAHVNYQGQLKSGGALFTGTATMKFAIVDGATSLWSNDGTSAGGNPPTGSVNVPVSNGLFTVQLGAPPMVPLSSAVFPGSGSPVLRVWVDTGSGFEQLSDQQFASVPYSFQSQSGGTGGVWSESNGNVYRATGNVGIGTTSPLSPLAIGVRNVTGWDSEMVVGEITNTRVAGMHHIRESDPLGRSALTFKTTTGSNYTEKVRITHDGKVGIGTTDPRATLEINSPTAYARLLSLTCGGNADSYIDWGSPSIGGQTYDRAFLRWSRDGSQGRKLTVFTSDYDGTTHQALTADFNGNVGVGTETPQAHLDVVGTMRAHVVEITGGDLAERFPVVEGAEPGTVLTIDPDVPGRLQICAEAMSRNVAGVVSGAGDLHAGVVLSGGSDYGVGTPVALSGRVWVKADATDRPIRVGDLLVSATRAGYASSAKNPSKAAGRILGKAMSKLDAGTGLVLVLVSLQ